VELCGEVERYGVTTVWLTAGLFHLVAGEGLGRLGAVRQVVAGGDVLRPGDVERVVSAVGCRMVNGYGPTEVTTFTCCYEVGGEGVGGGVVPIGRPIGNTRVYVLDGFLEPVPVGVRGELYAGGDGLARGYGGRAALTAERFVPDMYGGYGRRLYRTGDVARYRDGGEVEFVGRVDDQAKVRGYRVEPGEVAVVLARREGVREAVAVVRGGEAGEKRLVAYVVLEDGAGTVGASRPPTVDELRRYCSGVLPEYMVPSVFVVCDELPRTSSGKIDRPALPAPDRARPELEEAYIAPRTSVEREIADIWNDIIEIDRVGVHDNFFDLGGNSLLATQLVSRLRDSFQVELPLRRIFEDPTIEGLARMIGEGAEEKREETDRISSILKAMEHISDEDAKRMLEEEDTQ
jgi:acyl-coenzyme A synthetase/AMP-(fatty) acid ligase/acyl carrier protein